MKKFDLKQIMKNAWRTYKYVAKKQGKSFGEVLKSTWKMAKLQASVMKTMSAKNKPQSDINPINKSVYDWGSLTASDIYPDNNTGYLGSKYCGD